MYLHVCIFLYYKGYDRNWDGKKSAGGYLVGSSREHEPVCALREQNKYIYILYIIHAFYISLYTYHFTYNIRHSEKCMY